MKTHGRRPFLVLLYRRQGAKCYLCGHKMTLELGHPNTATIDHKLPKRARQRHRPGPRRAACLECNQWKDDRTMDEIIEEHCDP